MILQPFMVGDDLLVFKIMVHDWFQIPWKNVSDLKILVVYFVFYLANGVLWFFLSVVDVFFDHEHELIYFLAHCSLQMYIINGV